MKDYSNGKIYKIASKDTNKIYIGSTTGSLDCRMYRHQQDYVFVYINNRLVVKFIHLNSLMRLVLINVT